MANGQNRPPAGPQVPFPVGEAIGNDGQGKIQQFFTDPKNLATLLVLGTALAQPRNPDQTSLAHALRSGTGALAFRGGLDRDIQNRQIEEDERTVAQEQEAAQLSVQNRQVSATEGATTARSESAEADRASREGIAEAEIGAGKFRENRLSPDEQIFLAANKLHLEKLNNHALNQLPGPPPSFDESIREVMAGGMLAGIIDPGRVSFTPDAAVTDASTEPSDALPEPGRTPDPTGARDQRAFGGLKVPGSVLRLRRPTESRENLIPFVANRQRKRHPDVFKSLTDEQIVESIQQINSIVEAQLQTMTQEEAKAIKKDKFKFDNLTRENQRDIARIAAKGSLEFDPSQVLSGSSIL